MTKFGTNLMLHFFIMARISRIYLFLLTHLVLLRASKHI
jgi:hypothetical protein